MEGVSHHTLVFGPGGGYPSNIVFGPGPGGCPSGPIGPPGPPGPKGYPIKVGDRIETTDVGPAVHKLRGAVVGIDDADHDGSIGIWVQLDGEPLKRRFEAGHVFEPLDGSEPSVISYQLRPLDAIEALSKLA